MVLKLNIANYERNKLAGSLDGGDLRDDGYVMPPLTVHQHRPVVATDQCLFCKRRYFRNFGHHMVIAHGGQAKRANLTRRAWIPVGGVITDKLDCNFGQVVV